MGRAEKGVGGERYSLLLLLQRKSTEKVVGLRPSPSATVDCRNYIFITGTAEPRRNKDEKGNPSGRQVKATAFRCKETQSVIPVTSPSCMSGSAGMI